MADKQTTHRNVNETTERRSKPAIGRKRRTGDMKSDLIITTGNVEQVTHATVDKSVETSALLQLIYGAWPPSANMERRYRPGGYAMMMMMTMMIA